MLRGDLQPLARSDGLKVYAEDKHTEQEEVLRRAFHGILTPTGEYIASWEKSTRPLRAQLQHNGSCLRIFPVRAF